MMERILLFLLKGIASLPLGMLYVFSDFVYFIIYYVIGYRKEIVRKNLREAFPEKSRQELKKIEKEYYHFVSEIIVETVKLLRISEREMARRVEVVNAEEVNDKIKEGKSVVLMLGHYGNWEWVQEISRHVDDGVFKASIYRPLNSKTWDNLYGRIRSRWGSHIIPQKRAVRALLDRDHRPWVCGFIADHRPRSNNGENIVEFLNHETSVIYGPEEIGRKTGAAFFFLEMERMKRGQYRITFHELQPEEDGLPYPYTRAFWRAFEKAMRKKPSYWLWSHKRWKNDRVIPAKQ